MQMLHQIKAMKEYHNFLWLNHLSINICRKGHRHQNPQLWNLLKANCLQERYLEHHQWLRIYSNHPTKLLQKHLLMCIPKLLIKHLLKLLLKHLLNKPKRLLAMQTTLRHILRQVNSFAIIVWIRGWSTSIKRSVRWIRARTVLIFSRWWRSKTLP